MDIMSGNHNISFGKAQDREQLLWKKKLKISTSKTQQASFWEGTLLKEPSGNFVLAP